MNESGGLRLKFLLEDVLALKQLLELGRIGFLVCREDFV